MGFFKKIFGQDNSKIGSAKLTTKSEPKIDNQALNKDYNKAIIQLRKLETIAIYLHQKR